MKKFYISLITLCILLINPIIANASVTQGWNGFLDDNTIIQSTTLPSSIFDNNATTGYTLTKPESIVFIDTQSINSFTIQTGNPGYVYIDYYNINNVVIWTTYSTGGYSAYPVEGLNIPNVKKIVLRPQSSSLLYEFEVFGPPDTIAPSVLSINPTNNQLIQSPDTNVVINFSESITSDSVQNCNINGVETVKTLNGNLLTLNPVNSLDEGVTYTVTLSNVKDKAGNTMPLYTSKFSTYIDILPPQITSIVPINNSVNNPVNSTVNVTFNEIIDPLSLSECSIDGISYNATSSGNTLIIRPNTPLKYFTQYIATIKGVKDLKGNAMTDILNLTFKTEQDTRPVEVLNIIPPPDSTNVPTNTEIIVQFNKSNIDETTLEGVKLLDGDVEIPTTKSLINDSVSLILQSDLENLKTYYISISEIKDIIGNSMVTPINVSFQTVSDTSPFSVLNIKPPMSSVVGLSEEIIVEFNKNVLPSSIVYELLDKDGNPVSAIKSVIGKKFVLKPVHKNNQEYNFKLIDATDAYGNHIPSTNELTYETIKTTGDADVDGILSKLLNLFKNSKYFGLIIIGFAIGVGVLFIIARWLWRKLILWLNFRSWEKEFQKESL